jgi:AcrR family transcriptional regulator
MAKAGSPSQVTERSTGRSAETRRLLIAAAIETLKEEGYAGASARAIAERAESNQGLIFYHFGSVANLLLAALDTVSTERLAQYGTAIAAVDSPTALVDTARAIFSEDLDAGYVTVLVEMIAGAASTPGLGPEVAARISPWTAFAEDAITSLLESSPFATILPPADVAHGIVALYLGLEMLSHLNGNRAPSLALFDDAKHLATLFGAMTGPTPREEP